MGTLVVEEEPTTMLWIMLKTMVSPLNQLIPTVATTDIVPSTKVTSKSQNTSNQKVAQTSSMLFKPDLSECLPMLPTGVHMRRAYSAIAKKISTTIFCW